MGDRVEDHRLGGIGLPRSLGLGTARGRAFALIRGGGPEVDGWLRTLFGRVFGVVAVAMAAISTQAQIT